MKKIMMTILALAVGVTTLTSTPEAEARQSRQAIKRQQAKRQAARRAQARRAAARKQPVRKLRVKQGAAIKLEAIHCRFEPIGRPMAYVRYEPSTRTVWTQTGWPQQWREYNDVEVLTGLPPFGNQGISLIAFGDVPIIHLRLNDSGTTWYERNEYFPYESYWGLVPTGAKIKETKGVCWTQSQGPKSYGSEGPLRGEN